MELLKVTDGMNDLDKDEVDMVTGALVLSKKNVKVFIRFIQPDFAQLVSNLLVIICHRM